MVGAVAALLMVLNFAVAEVASAGHDAANHNGTGEAHSDSLIDPSTAAMAASHADHGDTHKDGGNDRSGHNHNNDCGTASCSLFLVGFDATAIDRSVDDVVAAVASNPWAAAPLATPYKPPRLSL